MPHPTDQTLEKLPGEGETVFRSIDSSGFEQMPERSLVRLQRKGLASRLDKAVGSIDSAEQQKFRSYQCRVPDTIHVQTLQRVAQSAAEIEANQQLDLLMCRQRAFLPAMRLQVLAEARILVNLTLHQVPGGVNCLAMQSQLRLFFFAILLRRDLIGRTALQR